MPSLTGIQGIVQQVSQIGGYGFPLNQSGSMMLGHMTKGDFSAMLGKWIPQFPALLKPSMPNGIFSQGFPLLSLVQNLQVSTQGLLEPVLNQVGAALNVRAGFLNTSTTSSLIDELSHNSGITLDLSVQGFAANPALIANEVARMLGTNASTINMVFNTATNDGHFHIEANANQILGDTGNAETRFITTDLATGDQVVGSFIYMNGYS